MEILEHDPSIATTVQERVFKHTSNCLAFTDIHRYNVNFSSACQRKQPKAVVIQYKERNIGHCTEKCGATEMGNMPMETLKRFKCSSQLLDPYISRYHRPVTNNTTMLLGYLSPVLCDSYCLPGGA